MSSPLIMKDLLGQFRGNGLKARAMRAGVWTVIGYGASQALRLASNLILARILFPSDFGIMALVSLVLQGVSLFSDIGIGSSIIQNKRGDDPTFLNTAWTMQVVRGLVLTIIILILAWPISVLYAQPILFQLLAVAGLTSLISGFNPTKLFSARRHITLGRITVLELLTQAVSLAVMIALALATKSVWALVIGGLTAAIFKVIFSNILLSGVKNSFVWHTDSVRQLFSFGGWIFLSSCLGFFVSQGDRIVLSTIMTMDQLGVYSIASMLAALILTVNSRVSDSVLFPIYSRKQNLTNDKLLPSIRQARIYIGTALLLPACGLIVFGDLVVGFLYDARYREAGWMLQVLVFGHSVLIATNIGPFYLAQGKSQLFFSLILVKSLILIIAMSIGGKMAGVNGIVIAVAVSNLIYYPVQIYVYRRFGLWIWRLDVGFGCVICISGIIAVWRSFL